MNFKNKIFIIFFVLLGFILFFNINNVFAAGTYENVVVSSFPEDILNALEDIEYYNSTDYYYYLRYSANKTYVNFIEKSQCTDFYAYFGFDFRNSDNLYVSAIYYGSSTPFTEITYLYNSGSKSFEFLASPNNITSTYVYIDPYDINSIYFNSNFNVYTDNTLSTIFFQSPVTEIQGVTIPALETAEQIPQAIATTLKILIPVGLIVLSSGLVVYLIKRVIY